MIRAAFVFVGFEWQGGINYLRSLFYALKLQPGRPIVPVLVVSPELVGKARAVFGDIEIVSTALVDAGSAVQRLRKILERALKRDILLERMLINNNINLCSHGPILGPGSRIPSLAWIPDFQHVYLPQFFSPLEIKKRNRMFRRISDYAAGVIVSSESARLDCEAFMSESTNKLHVMHFVPSVASSGFLDLPDLEQKYGFMGRYLFMPNQFWAHKNHVLVIEALGILKKSGKFARIICTGSTEDGRNPRHIALIRERIKVLELDEQVLILGSVPYIDMLSLMVYSHALINPSLFEGWSTTVEEAKLIGKRTGLSDILVHREQGPNDAEYFDPYSAEACSLVLDSLWNASVKPTRLEGLDRRIEEESYLFGEKYLKIVKGLFDKI